MEEERKKQSKNKYRSNNDDDEEESSSESEEDIEEKNKRGDESDDDDSDDESDDDENKKAKGVSGLIDIENPNRVQKKTQKLKAVTTAPVESSSSSGIASGAGTKELSRREREELEKQRAQAHYQKLHAEGKTEQARADLARLAIIKQHRAEAAARREKEKKGLLFK